MRRGTWEEPRPALQYIHRSQELSIDIITRPSTMLDFKFQEARIAQQADIAAEQV